MVQNENSEEDRLRSLYCEIDNTKMHYQTEQIVIHTDQQQEQDVICSGSVGYPWFSSSIVAARTAVIAALKPIHCPASG